MDEEYGVPPTVSIDELEKEIRQGEKIDPDNAFYNYIWAAILFNVGPNGKVIQMKTVMNGLSMIRLFWIRPLSSCARQRQSLLPSIS